MNDGDTASLLTKGGKGQGFVPKANYDTFQHKNKKMEQKLQPLRNKMKEIVSVNQDLKRFNHKLRQKEVKVVENEK